jgi:hypothetical protein
MSASDSRPAQRNHRAGRSQRIALIVFRLGMSVLMTAAVFAQLATYETYWHRIGLHDLALRTGNFFSAFTFEVNLLGAAVLAAGAWMLWRRDDVEPLWFTRTRLCVLAAIVIVGVVYNLLLRSAPTGPGELLDWANNVVHVVAPVAIVLDWLVAPRSPRLPFNSALIVAAYPIAWLAYTLIRGLLVPDELLRTPYYYPYGFLNPHEHGWGPVVTMIGELLVLVIAVGFVGVLIARLEDRFTRPRIRVA